MTAQFGTGNTKNHYLHSSDNKSQNEEKSKVKDCASSSGLTKVSTSKFDPNATCVRGKKINVSPNVNNNDEDDP